MQPTRRSDEARWRTLPILTASMLSPARRVGMGSGVRMRARAAGAVRDSAIRVRVRALHTARGRADEAPSRTLLWRTCCSSTGPAQQSAASGRVGKVRAITLTGSRGSTRRPFLCFGDRVGNGGRVSYGRVPSFLTGRTPFRSASPFPTRFTLVSWYALIALL